MEFLGASVDIYCERTSPAYWAEPLNALSNLAFVAAGLAGLAAARRAEADGWTRLLCWWVIAIGIGSWLFHTHATVWAGFADTLPIWSFVVVYFAFGLRRFFGRSWRGVLAILSAGLAGTVVVMWAIPAGFVRATGGSIQYLPALVALVAFSIFLRLTRRPAAAPILIATLVFCISLFFRTIDMLVCDSFPPGTHFLWHLLNGAMLGILLFAAIRHGQPGAERTTPGHEDPALFHS